MTLDIFNDQVKPALAQRHRRWEELLGSEPDTLNGRFCGMKTTQNRELKTRVGGHLLPISALATEYYYGARSWARGSKVVITKGPWNLRYFSSQNSWFYALEVLISFLSVTTLNVYNGAKSGEIAASVDNSLKSFE